MVMFNGGQLSDFVNVFICGFGGAHWSGGLGGGDNVVSCSYEAGRISWFVSLV